MKSSTFDAQDCRFSADTHINYSMSNIWQKLVLFQRDLIFAFVKDVVTSQTKFHSTIASSHVGGRRTKNVFLNISIYETGFSFSFGFPQ